MSERSDRIAALNDQFRQSFSGGRVIMTSGIANLVDATQALIFHRVRTFDNFSEGDDPYGEHDFGAIDVEDVGKVFWKIDYYDPTLTYGSEDPTDLKQTARVLTIMLAHEY